MARKTELIKLTKTSVESLETSDSGDALYRDSELLGFGVRVRASGMKSYFVERMVAGRNVRVAIGRHGEITATEARAKAQATLAQMSTGVDPVAARKEAAEVRRAVSVTFGAVANDYIALRLTKSMKLSTANDYRRDLDGGLDPIAAMPIDAITRKTITDLHASLSAKGPTSANRAMRFARAVFNFAVENEDYTKRNGEPLITASPITVLKAKRLWNPRNRKHGYVPFERLGGFTEAVLSIDGLRWCQRLENGPRRAETVSLYLLMLVCLGLRTGESYVIRQVDWDAADQVLLIADPKNANTAQEPFTLPVGWRIAQMISQQIARYRGEWLLSDEAGDGPLCYPRAIVEDVRLRGGARFTPHDLRRTFASMLNALSPAPSEYQIKRLLNHTPDRSDVTTDYIQHEREDLRAIVQRIEDVVFGSITAARPLFSRAS